MNIIREETFEIAVCRGATADGCRFSALPIAGLASKLNDLIKASGWPALLSKIRSTTTRAHTRLRLSVAACPNGCSRPHIVDFAFVAAMRPVLPQECTGCGICLRSCPDQALSIPAGAKAPILDENLCLACGRCIGVCPEGQTLCGPSGLRLLLGGRLGRRPRLAVEIPGIWHVCDVETLLSPLLSDLVASYRPGQRIADIILDRWPALIHKTFA
ncbi:MAG: 4Fe-4S dicluster domain-containing protein [Deltaproteobacteria bacterium]|nr:4Fe-4S dicluster domain-containing protein [Deltaproteobacteria bacterium]